jgi:hypothetical protein
MLQDLSHKKNRTDSFCDIAVDIITNHLFYVLRFLKKGLDVVTGARVDLKG